MTRPEPAQTCLCVQPQNTTIKRLHVFIYVREKLWDSSCFTFQDVIYRIPGWYLRVCPPPNPPHLSLSLSLYGLHYSCILQLTHLLQRGGRTFNNMWSFILSQIYLIAAETWILHMQDSQQRFRTSGSNIEIFRDGSRFQSFIDHWTQLYTSVNSAASLYGRTWQQSRAALLSGTSLCSNTGQSLSFTEKINVKLRDHLWWKSKIPVFVVSHTNCPEIFTHIILTVASL